MEKNAKNGTFFYIERKRTQRMERSFIKNAKARKERNVLLKRTVAQPCPMLLLAGSNNSMLIRAIIELTTWSNVVFTDSVSYCAGAMRDATNGLRKNSTGDCAASSCRLLLPAGLGSVSFKKKWESGGTNLPAGVPPVPTEDEMSSTL